MNDREAYELSAANNFPEPTRQYGLTVARGEGGYGASWAKPSAFVIAKSKEFGLTGFEGINSNNWGAVQGTGNAGSFQHIDRHANGEWYVGKFKKYLTPADGFGDMMRVLLGGGLRGARGATAIKAALDVGNATDAVYAQHANGYFELNPDEYLIAVKRNHARLVAALGVPSALKFPLRVGRPLPPGQPSEPSGTPSGEGPFVIGRVTNLPVLWLGSYGPAVEVLCMALAIERTPRFDGVMKRIVMKYQTDNGLKADGVVGLKTWERVLKL